MNKKTMALMINAVESSASHGDFLKDCQFWNEGTTVLQSCVDEEGED